MKRALITGITGQDGSYLADFLLQKGYRVFGLTRKLNRASASDKITLLKGDLLDQNSLINVLEEAKPDEIYNLGAHSFVQTSWNHSVLTAELTAMSVTKIIDAALKVCPKSRFYQASSSELFGKVQSGPQNEETRFYPRSPYGVAKLYGHWITVNFRESFGYHASSGIMFNHESPRRGLEYVTRKISHTAALIKNGLAKELRLGNIEGRRDWGFAGDYVEAMWLMLQQEKADDYVVATGETHSVKDFLDLAFARVDLDWKEFVKTDEKLYRPIEVSHLVGDYSKAKRVLGWTPKVDFKNLVFMMVDHDMEVARKLKSEASK
ncbi:MAG: GDP-mannose 4,6-dehydratase [Bdellovibrionales bacterium GWA2_49_15]|nr:MAG: GDP-mannose 4,6-dehydratase [Bdellovibrionales bacterium GWA2_49_15]